MNKTKQRVQQLKQNRENKVAGRNSLIPFYYHFPKLANHVPGLFKEGYYALTASTGVGKTKATKYFTIILPYLLSKQIGLKYKTIYFALEESEEEFIDHLLILMLKEKHNVDIDYAKLNSYRKDPPDESIMLLLDDVSDDVEQIMNNVIVIDSVSNPSGMYFKCKEYAQKWGKLITDDENRLIGYEPNDPDEFVIVVTDHVSLITQEYDSHLKQTLSKHQSMSKWSSTYALKVLTKKFKWIVWDVHQTTMSSEGTDNRKTNTLEPSMEDLADNKTVARNYKVLFTLFSPYKNRIEKYNGYTISSRGGGLKHSFINLGIIKNRYGISPVNIAMHFDGASGKYQEINKENQRDYFIK